MDSKAALSEADIALVREYLLHQIVLEVLESDYLKVQKSQPRMIRVLERFIKATEKKEIQNAYDLRKQMRSLGIKVYEQFRDSEALRAKYLCRGYHYEIGLLWPFVKDLVMQRIAAYNNIDLTKTDD